MHILNTHIFEIVSCGYRFWCDIFVDSDRLFSCQVLVFYTPTWSNLNKFVGRFYIIQCKVRIPISVNILVLFNPSTTLTCSYNLCYFYLFILNVRILHMSTFQAMFVYICQEEEPCKTTSYHHLTKNHVTMYIHIAQFPKHHMYKRNGF